MASNSRTSRAKAARVNAARVSAVGYVKPARSRTARALGAAATPVAVPPLSLGPALTIREVGEARRAIQRMLAGGAASADLRSLECIDTAGVQLLLAAAMAAQVEGRKLKLLGASALLTGAAEALDLAAHLASAAELTE